MSESVKVVILAGGQGTRFWPKSRMKAPKQFLSISANGESLIQATARRIKDIASAEDVWVVTNRLHSPMVREHIADCRIISEPIGRNTAPSIGLAAAILMKESPNSVMVVLPADHAVSDEGKLRDCLREAIALAGKNDILATIGITPAYPHTGYGYIQRGEKKLSANGYSVSRFFEKPNLDRAKEYCQAGNYFWNSGMFVWRPEVLMKALQDFMPRLHESLMRIVPAIGTDREQEVIDEIFPALESVSIDLGVLEHARNCAVVAAEPFGWNDVGSWDAWAEHFERDKKGNLSHGEVLTMDSKDCIIYGQDKLIAVLGANDLVVIDSGDAMLICPRNRVQDVKSIVEELKARGRQDLI